MAGKGIEIDIAANTRDFQKGTKDVEKALDEVADALDDVSKDADKSGKNIGDELSDGARDAEKSVEKLERSFKEVADASKRETRSAGTAMKNNTKDATTQAQRDLAELKDEAVQNASETFSSFDGSMSSFADGIQGTFGGIVSNMGPVGAAAGAAGALGIGAIMAAFEDAQEAEAEFRAQVAELASELIEHGGEGAEGVNAIAESLKALALETEDGKKKLTDVAKEAERLGVPIEGLAQAYAGSADALEEYGETAAKVAEEERELARASGAMSDANSKSHKENQEKIGDYTALIEGVESLKKEQGEAADIERLWHESGGAALQARSELMETLQGELDDAIGSWKDYTNAETGATDPGKYIAAMQARMDATSNFNSNVQTLAEQFGLTFEEQQAIIDQGVDFAPMLQSIIDSGMGEQYAEQIRAMLDGGQAIVDGTPTTATVEVKSDTDQAKADLDETAEERTADVEAEASTKAAKATLDKFVAQKRTAKIGVSVDTASASTALANFINRKRTAVVTVETRDREGRLVP